MAIVHNFLIVNNNDCLKQSKEKTLVKVAAFTRGSPKNKILFTTTKNLLMEGFIIMCKKSDFVKAEFMGCKFYLNIEKPGKLEKDLAAVKAIFDKGIENLSHIDRMALLAVYKPAYHESGKIEGITSFDSTATNCGFCQQMREANKNNPACICNYCYDFAQEQYRIQALNRHTLNMLIMSNVEFSVKELATLPATGIIRIDSSGDTPNLTYARNMIKICYAFPHANVGYWAKNVAPVIAACDELGKPGNVVLVQSSVLIGRSAKKAKYFDYVFTVYPDKETTLSAIANGAAECNGKKCRECGYKCYFGTHESDNIAELLRGASKETVAAIKTKLNA